MLISLVATASPIIYPPRPGILSKWSMGSKVLRVLKVLKVLKALKALKALKKIYNNGVLPIPSMWHPSAISRQTGCRDSSPPLAMHSLSIRVGFKVAKFESSGGFSSNVFSLFVFNSSARRHRLWRRCHCGGNYIILLSSSVHSRCIFPLGACPSPLPACRPSSHLSGQTPRAVRSCFLAHRPW